MHSGDASAGVPTLRRADRPGEDHGVKIVPKDWRDFQHYKDRSPPWIRLHKRLLDNYEFHCLPVASRALAPMLWLLASDSLEGVIDAASENLAFRLRQSTKDVAAALKPLIDKGFFVVQQVASSTIADGTQGAVPETEERQRQRQPRLRATSLPSGFGISERVRSWAQEKGHNHLDLQLEAFLSYAKRKGATYVDWEEALMNAIRDDWAKARGKAEVDHFAGAQ